MVHESLYASSLFISFMFILYLLHDANKNRDSAKTPNVVYLQKEKKTSTNPPPQTPQTPQTQSQKTLTQIPQSTGTVQINVATRGPPEEPRHLGVLTSEDNTMNLPLYGRRMWSGSTKWLYFTQNDKFVSVMLPVYKDNRNCSKDYGCDELYENDTVTVPQLNTTDLKVTLYQLDAPRYIPF